MTKFQDEKFPSYFKLVVKPGMQRTEFLGFDSERRAFRMNLHARPEKGKANMEILKYFRKEFKKNIEIVSGTTSREKFVRIL